jgi:hypothetical protein
VSPAARPERIPLYAARRTGGFDLVDDALEGWVIRIEPVDRGDPRPLPPVATLALLRLLADRLPQVKKLVSTGSDLRVQFSPGVRRALEAGRYQAMHGTGTMPLSVEDAGPFVTMARTPRRLTVDDLEPDPRGLGPSASWGVALAAAVGAAAVADEARWLESTFGELQDALPWIESPTADADLGTLEATELLVEQMQPTVVDGTVSTQLRLELAVARQRVDALYLARFRLIQRLELRPDGDPGLFDDLVVLLHAMISRTRVAFTTAGVLAQDAQGVAALRLLTTAIEALRDDYRDLYRTTKTLAAHLSEQLRTLEKELRTRIGETIDERDDPPTIEVPSGALTL